MIKIEEIESVMDDPAAKSIFEDAYLLNHVWKVKDEEARKAAQSSHDALMGRFYLMAPANPAEKISAAAMEEWWFDCCRAEPHKAIDAILKTEWVAKERYFKNIPQFYERLARHLKKKRSRQDAVQPNQAWKLAMIALWCKSVNGAPPRCLWSDAALLDLSPGPKPPSEAAIRKEISLLKLSRPKSPAYGISRDSSGSIRFVRRARGSVVTKKK